MLKKIALKQFDIIIGPIEKNDMETIQASLAPNTLIIALGNKKNHSGDNVLYFSLDPITEVQQIIQAATREGFHHAMILTSEEAWQTKISNTFISSWEALGGEITLKTLNHSTSLDKQLKSSLKITSSESKARKVQQIINQEINFLPNPRDDIDVIFLSTSGTQARLIKPLLKYYFAVDIRI